MEFDEMQIQQRNLRRIARAGNAAIVNVPDANSDDATLEDEAAELIPDNPYVIYEAADTPAPFTNTNKGYRPIISSDTEFDDHPTSLKAVEDYEYDSDQRSWVTVTTVLEGTSDILFENQPGPENSMEIVEENNSVEIADDVCSVLTDVPADYSWEPIEEVISMQSKLVLKQSSILSFMRKRKGQTSLAALLLDDIVYNDEDTPILIED
jgi:hypothetical protein